MTLWRVSSWRGKSFSALNGGPKYKFNEAISFSISVEKQQEVDYFWEADLSLTVGRN